MVRGIAFSSQLLRMGNEGGEGSRKGPLVWFSVAAPRAQSAVLEGAQPSGGLGS